VIKITREHGKEPEVYHRETFGTFVKKIKNFPNFQGEKP
jgi:hypothetical protein